MTYSKMDEEQKKVCYFDVVLPLLARRGYNTHIATEMFKEGRVRLRWGRDWKNFTVHLDNPCNEPTCLIDNMVHSVWAGMRVPNTLVMTCFIKGNEVSSLAITDLYTLSEGFRRYGVGGRNRNSINGQSFLTIPFSHHSLSRNMWGIGI